MLTHVFIISDFIGLKNDWKQYLRLIGKKYDLIGIMIRDPGDETLPDFDGQVVLGDPSSDRQQTVNVAAIRDEFAKYVAASEKEIATAFTDSKSNFIKLTTDKPFLKPILDLFLRRLKSMR